MTLVSVIEGGILTLVVLVSSVFACRRLFPGTSMKLQSAMARWLDAPMRPMFLRYLGRRLTPDVRASVGCAAVTGCSTCGGCTTAATSPNDEIALPLTWHAPRGRDRDI